MPQLPLLPQWWLVDTNAIISLAIEALSSWTLTLRRQQLQTFTIFRPVTTVQLQVWRSAGTGSLFERPPASSSREQLQRFARIDQVGSSWHAVRWISSSPTKGNVDEARLDSSQSCLSLMVSLILVGQSTLPKSSQNLQSWTPLDCHNTVLDEAHH